MRMLLGICLAMGLAVVGAPASAQDGEILRWNGHAVALAPYAAWLSHVIDRTRLGGTTEVGIRTVAMAAMVTVGLARIAGGAHWPADVLLGFALGSAAAAVAWWDLMVPLPVSSRPAVEPSVGRSDL